MNKVKFIDVIANDFMPKNKTIRINGSTVDVKTNIDAENYTSIIRTIAENCFVDNQYHPAYFEIVRRYVILDYFTNIDVENISLNEVFKTSQNGNWFDKIEKIVTSLPIWNRIESATNAYIDYKIKSRKTSFDNLCDSFNSLAEENSKIDVGVINELNDRLKNIGEVKVASEISSSRTDN